MQSSGYSVWPAYSLGATRNTAIGALHSGKPPGVSTTRLPDDVDAMATLVTGGTGFVGSNIVRTLAQQGHQVVCFDLALPGALLTRYIQSWADKVTFLQGDILSPEDVEQAEDHNIDKIVHAAVFTGVLPEVEASRSRSIVDINVMGTTNLLELARRIKPQRFLYVSSGSVYGDRPEQEEVLREDADLHPHTLYESTKYASELLTRRYGEMHGFPTVATRLSSPYGPMERVTGHRANQSVVKDLTGMVVRGVPIVVSDRSLGRDYTYVADIASGICSVLDAPNPSHFAYGELPEMLAQNGSAILNVSGTTSCEGDHPYATEQTFIFFYRVFGSSHVDLTPAEPIVIDCRQGGNRPDSGSYLFIVPNGKPGDGLTIVGQATGFQIRWVYQPR